VARSSSGSSLPFLGSGMVVALAGRRGRVGGVFEVVMGREWKYGLLGGVECIYFLEKLGRLKMGALPWPGLFFPFL
jgi:hypothetical protein